MALFESGGDYPDRSERMIVTRSGETIQTVQNGNLKFTMDPSRENAFYFTDLEGPEMFASSTNLRGIFRYLRREGYLDEKQEQVYMDLYREMNARRRTPFIMYDQAGEIESISIRDGYDYDEFEYTFESSGECWMIMKRIERKNLQSLSSETISHEFRSRYRTKGHLVLSSKDVKEIIDVGEYARLLTEDVATKLKQFIVSKAYLIDNYYNKVKAEEHEEMMVHLYDLGSEAMEQEDRIERFSLN